MSWLYSLRDMQPLSQNKECVFHRYPSLSYWLEEHLKEQEARKWWIPNCVYCVHVCVWCVWVYVCVCIVFGQTALALFLVPMTLNYSERSKIIKTTVSQNYSSWIVIYMGNKSKKYLRDKHNSYLSKLFLSIYCD